MYDKICNYDQILCSYFLVCLVQVICFIDFPILKGLQTKNVHSIKLYNFRLGSLAQCLSESYTQCESDK